MNLRDYLHFNRVKCKTMAIELGVSYAYLRLIKDSGVKPSEKLAKEIEIFTGGQVSVEELRGKEKQGA